MMHTPQGGAHERSLPHIQPASAPSEFVVDEFFEKYGGYLFGVAVTIIAWFSRRERTRDDAALKDHSDRISKLERTIVTREELSESLSNVGIEFRRGMQSMEKAIDDRHADNLRRFDSQDRILHGIGHIAVEHAQKDKDFRHSMPSDLQTILNTLGTLTKKVDALMMGDEK
jgi:hypothetical protein